MGLNTSPRYSEDNIHPGFSLDCVLLCFHKGKLQVLLREFDIVGYWALLGGFMFKDEDSDSAASRILEYYTGYENIYIRQFYLFSSLNRTIAAQNENYIERNPQWGFVSKRHISMGYFALVKYENVILPPEYDGSPKLRWYDISDLPTLYSDHKFIIEKALQTIKLMLPVIPVGYELLPEKFTMTELRRIYEILLNKIFDRRNFQKKVLSEGNVIQLKDKKDNSSYNPACLFSFDKQKIELLLSEKTSSFI